MKVRTIPTSWLGSVSKNNYSYTLGGAGVGGAAVGEGGAVLLYTLGGAWMGGAAVGEGGAVLLYTLGGAGMGGAAVGEGGAVLLYTLGRELMQNNYISMFSSPCACI